MRLLWWGIIVSGVAGLLWPSLPGHAVPLWASPRIDQTELFEPVSIETLLQSPGRYHQRPIRIRGTVTRLELHLDESEHFIDFVFFLTNGHDRVLVFGRHDRTLGDIQMTTGRTVEVHGIFWREREANGHRLLNNIEAHRVTFYPPLTPEHAALPSVPFLGL